MKKQHGYINGDGLAAAFIVCLIIAGFIGYGVLRGAEWVFTTYSVEVKKK
jgi:hypothetical protein